MAEQTRIEWANATFNPWIGCSHVSPGCENCYAERFGKRRSVEWGPGKARARTSSRNWSQPRRWNARALAAGETTTVFCASLADYLDPEVPVEWLAELLGLISETPALRWLLLTKRPELWRGRMVAVASLAYREAKGGGPADVPAIRGLGAALALAWLRGDAPPNVRPGTTVEDQRRAGPRLAALLDIPTAHPRGRFLSLEPLLSAVDLVLAHPDQQHGARARLEGIGWLIVGGESGPGARPMHPDWARDLREQARVASLAPDARGLALDASPEVAFMFKQWGDWLPKLDRDRDDPDWRRLPVTLGPGERWLNLAGGHGFRGDRVHLMERVGKHAAGALLDGRRWLEVGQ